MEKAALTIDDVISSINLSQIGLTPYQVAQNYNNIGFWFQGNDFTPHGRELYGALVQRIGLSLIDRVNTKCIYSSYVRPEGKGQPFGQYAQFLKFNPALPIDFKNGFPGGSPNPYKRVEPNIISSYTAINSQTSYCVTIDIPTLLPAFINGDGINVAIRAMIQSLAAGSAMYNDRMFTDLVGELGQVAIGSLSKPQMTIEIPPITDSNSAIEFFSSVVTMVNAWRTLRSDSFNITGAINIYDTDELVLFVRNSYFTKASFQRAVMYNADFTALGIEVECMNDFEGIEAYAQSGNQIIPLYPGYDIWNNDGTRNSQLSGRRTYWSTEPTLPSTTERPPLYLGEVQTLDGNRTVQAILVPKKAIAILEQYRHFKNKENEAGLYTNYFLHEGKSFGAIISENICAFVTPESVTTANAPT